MIIDKRMKSAEEQKPELRTMEELREYIRDLQERNHRLEKDAKYLQGTIDGMEYAIRCFAEGRDVHE